MWVAKARTLAPNRRLRDDDRNESSKSRERNREFEHGEHKTVGRMRGCFSCSPPTSSHGYLYLSPYPSTRPPRLPGIVLGTLTVTTRTASRVSPSITCRSRRLERNTSSAWSMLAVVLCPRSTHLGLSYAPHRAQRCFPSSGAREDATPSGYPVIYRHAWGSASR